MIFLDWAAKRLGYVKPVARRSYAGAAFNRLTSDWIAQSTSQDSEARTSLRALRNRTRQLCRDNDYARNGLRAIKNNVIGQGIPFQSQVPMKRGGKLNEKLNAQIEAAWQKWARKDSCHVAGMLSFADIERQLIGACAESGEVLIRIINKPFGRSKIPISLEIIESDQLIDDRNGRADNGNEIRMGVERDSWGRPVAYWLYPHHPGDYQFQAIQPSKYVRVPASEMIHLFVPERPGQTRGVPWFHSALKRLHNVGGFEEAEIVAARASACIMGFIETPDGELIGDSVDPNSGERTTNLEAGVVEALGPGEKFQGFSPTRPSGTFDPFMRTMIRGVAAGIGMSYETLSKDYSQSNYSSSRLSLLDDRDNWRALQRWMIENFHQIILEKWMDVAVLSGDITLPDYYAQEDIYQAVRWMPRGWAWVDPMKEAMAYRVAVRNGFMTLSDVITQAGGDFDDTMAQRKRETDIFKELELVFDSDPSQVNDKGMAQIVDPTDAGGDPPPAPGDETGSTGPAKNAKESANQN